MANFTATSEEFTTFFEEIVEENTTTAEMEVVADVPGAPRPPDYQGLVFGTSLVILIILMNAISLIAFTIEKRLRTYNNYFIINLTIADLALGINQTVGIAHTFLAYFPFDRDICRFYLGFRHALFSVSVVGVVVICIDRHRATYDPINHFISRSKRKATIMNALTWLISFGFWMPYTVGWDFAVDHDNGRHCVGAFSRSTVGNIAQNIFSFFVPLVLISVLYLRIFHKIKETVGGKSVNSHFDEPKVKGKLGKESPSLSSSMTTVAGDLSSGGTMEMKIPAPQVTSVGKIVKVCVRRDNYNFSLECR
eukprot:XP_003730830.1 PREDICTED: muscarinic acetylcholine receptor M2-like [Strongylocentrotus purpuratus]